MADDGEQARMAAAVDLFQTLERLPALALDLGQALVGISERLRRHAQAAREQPMHRLSEAFRSPAIEQLGEAVALLAELDLPDIKLALERFEAALDRLEGN